MSYDFELCSFSNLYATSPTSQLILKPFCSFTYVTAHSPTLPLPPTSQLVLQPFFRFSYVTGSSLTSLGEPPMGRDGTVPINWHLWRSVVLTSIRRIDDRGNKIVRCAETHSRPDTPPSRQVFPQKLSLSLSSPPLPDVIHLKGIHHHMFCHVISHACICYPPTMVLHYPASRLSADLKRH